MEPLGDIIRRTQLLRDRIGPVPEAPPVEKCPICHGAGYLRYDVPADDPRFGELVTCECTRRELEQRRLRTLEERSNLSHLRHLTFEAFILKYREGRPPVRSADAAYQSALRFAQNPSGWLVLFGPYGVGKTHLAAAIANHQLSLGRPAVFIVVPDLLDHLRSTFSPNSDVSYDELFETVRQTPLLVLDDLGAQTTTPWAQEKLYQVLNHRHNSSLPTVITTNLEPDEIEPRLRSRLADAQLSQLVEIREIDKRLGIMHERTADRRQADQPRHRRPSREAGF